MSYELVRAPPKEETIEETYSYDPLDDGTDCEHVGHLTYGNILRTKINGRPVCVDGRIKPRASGTPYTSLFPPKPAAHPIKPEKLDEWKEKSLVALDQLSKQPHIPFGGFFSQSQEQLRAWIEQQKKSVVFFAKNLTHVSHEKFVEALGSCCLFFHFLYSDRDFLKISSTSLESYKSERWVEDIAIEKRFLRIPERSFATRPNKKKIMLKTVNFKVEDGMYSGSQFLQALQHGNFQVYICPFISGGKYFREQFIAKTEDSVEDPEVLKKYTVFFVRSTDALVTHTLSWNNSGRARIHDVKTEMTGYNIDTSNENHIVFIYHSLMEDDNGKAIPFYFDHKLADEISWDWDVADADFSWMFAGLHLPPYYAFSADGECTEKREVYDNAKGEEVLKPYTPYIKGCEGAQGSMDEIFNGPCPDRPAWHL